MERKGQREGGRKFSCGSHMPLGAGVSQDKGKVAIGINLIVVDPEKVGEVIF